MFPSVTAEPLSSSASRQNPRRLSCCEISPRVTRTETAAGGFSERDFPRWLPERLAIFIPVAFKDLKAALVFSYKNKKDTVFLVDAVDVGWLVKNLECFF